MPRMPFMPEPYRRRRSTAEGVRERREARFARMREEQQQQRGRVDSTTWREDTLRRLRERQGE